MEPLTPKQIYNREYYKRNKEMLLEKGRKWFYEHREESNTARKEWYANHREYSLEKRREYYRLNAEKICAKEKIRRERLEAEGKCKRCASPLYDETDSGFVLCLTCREEIPRPTKMKRRFDDTASAQR